MSNMNQMMKQAQALQRKLMKAQEDLAEREVTGSAGGGMVTVVASGAGEVKRITIDPQVVDPDDVEMLQDMVTAAVAEALRTAKELEQDLLGGMSGGMGLPPGLF